MLEPHDPQRYQWALRGTGLALWDWDMVTGQTIFDERWAEIIGYTLDELQPTTIDTWVRFSHPEDLARSNAAIEAHAAGDTPFYDIEVRMRHRDGHWVWVHDRGQIVDRAEDGTPLRMLGTHEDITRRVERDTELSEARSVFDHSLEGIIILDAQEIITTVNPAFTAITGWSADQVIGRSFNDFRTHASDPEESDRLRALARSESGLRVQRDFFRPDGTTVPMLMSIQRVLDQRGNVVAFVAQLSDIGDRIRAEADRLDRALYIDQSTGLPNRRRFLDHIDTELRSLRTAHRTSALLLLSMDRFDAITSGFGHEVGELIATIIADRLTSALLPGDSLARTSRESFGILLGGVLSRSEVEARARTLLETVREVCQIPKAGEIYVTACIGITLLPEDAVSGQQAMQRATAALNSALESGSGAIRFHEEGFVTETRERVVRVAQIRQAWLDGEFRLDYQPIHQVADGALVGVEALMRWESPLLGSVPPSHFIPLAEDIGLIVELGDWVINEAVRQGSIWRQQGLDLQVSVNVAAPQLARPTFLDTVQQALNEWDFPADRLDLEMTETTLLHASGGLIQLLARLGELGVRIAIDDFGTGYSSFAYLRQYPVDKLKIDKCFIVDLEDRPNARSIVAAIIDLGHHLDLTVLAEGVENPGQLRILRDLGCDLYQGFLSSPAISAQALAKLAAGQ